jgi:hypothetical protein
MQLLFGMPHANHGMCCQKVRRVVLEMVPSGRVCIEIGSVPRLPTFNQFDRTQSFSASVARCLRRRTCTPREQAASTYCSGFGYTKLGCVIWPEVSALGLAMRLISGLESTARTAGNTSLLLTLPRYRSCAAAHKSFSSHREHFNCS